MSRKFSCNSHLCCTVRSISILTILITIAALAYFVGAIQASGQAAFPGNDSQSRERAGRTVQTGRSLFLAPIVYRLPNRADNGATSVAVADVNGDDKPDLIAGNASYMYRTPGIDVRLGNSDGTFQMAQSYDAGARPKTLTVSDVNGDGKADVIVAYICPGDCASFVGVLLGNGDGSFQPVTTYETGGDSGTPAVDVVAADVNGDGNPDLVVAKCGYWCVGSGEGLVGVLLGNGDGTFQAAVTYDSGGWEAQAVAVADINGDGKPDVVVGNKCSPGCGPSSIGVLLGNGDGTLQTATVYVEIGGGQPDSIVIADVNGDGKPDVIAANLFDSSNGGYHGSVAVLLGKGDGTFKQPVIYDSGGYDATSVAVVDVNGDSKLDVLVGNLGYTVGVLLGNGDGTFQAPVTSPSAASSIAVADVNRDGRPDLLLAFGTVSVLWNGTAPNLTTTVLDTSGSPSIRGQSVTFTATVKSTPGVPDGKTITFYDSFHNRVALIGTATTANGVAKLTISTLQLGKHLIEAVYPGDAEFTPGFDTVTQVVKVYSTTTALTSAPNPSKQGQAVTFTATVISAGPNPPTGKVGFMDGKTRIGVATLTGGVATLVKSTLAVGTHPITAVYRGDIANAKSTSPVVSQVVQ